MAKNLQHNTRGVMRIDMSLVPTILPVAAHTDQVGQGSTFVAIKGMAANGSHFIPLALEKGATCIVVEEGVSLSQEVQDAIIIAGARLIRVKNSRMALAQLSAEAAGFPAKALRIIGVTGTKGKTTTVCLLAQMLRAAGNRVAVMNGVAHEIGELKGPAQLTTAQPDYLHQFFARCVVEKIEYVVMEVAAQAHTLYRIEGLAFDGMIFTNFGHEHLEFYDSMDDYFASKVKMLSQVSPSAPLLLNSDDIAVSALKEQYPHALSFGLGKGVDIKGDITSISKGQVAVTVVCETKSVTLEGPALLGEYNGMNALAAAGMALHLGCTPQAVQEAVATYVGVPGRLQQIELSNGATAVVDYAHNPLSYEAVLPLLRSMTDHLIVLFGAGGERDPSRRPVMGCIASRYADVVVLTADNPRREDPAVIVHDIRCGIAVSGAAEVVVELDRACAIKKAYACSRPGSIIAVLGKGTDAYQIIGKTVHPFSDEGIIRTLGA